MDEQRVLLLGASQVRYSDSGPADSVLGLLESHLARLRPDIAWRCENRPLHYGARMPEFALRAIDEVKPSAVVLGFVIGPFTWPNPMGRIRRRWPRVYRLARNSAEFLKKLAGGGNVSSPRGLIFRAPRQLLAWTIGAEPEVDADAAMDSTVATLDALARREDVAIVCGLTLFPAAQESRRTTNYATVQDRFRELVKDGCRRHHFGLYDRIDQAARLGHAIGYGINKDYADLPTRRQDAESLAALIVAGLEFEASAPAATTHPVVAR
ncbi:MAG TPA: hypothetical protein VH951_07190 [Dehalococcoidia bacterium]|jgi:hypothetical protein